MWTVRLYVSRMRETEIQAIKDCVRTPAHRKRTNHLENLGVDETIMYLTEKGSKDVLWNQLPYCPVWSALVNLISLSTISFTIIRSHVVTVLIYTFWKSTTT